jgi:hypothetical protein
MLPAAAIDSASGFGNRSLLGYTESGDSRQPPQLIIASGAKQSISPLAEAWIASRSLPSGAHSRDPLARNDGGYSRVPCSLHASERNRAGERAGSRANRAAVIAAMNDPLAVRRLSRDDPDVMRPDDHHADSGTAGIHAFVRPGARERKPTVRFAEIFA